MAITTSSICVGVLSPCSAGAGAVATQNITDPGLGPLLWTSEAGLRPKKPGAHHLRRANLDYRQLTVIDNQGRTACFTGANIWGERGIQARTALRPETCWPTPACRRP